MKYKLLTILFVIALISSIILSLNAAPAFCRPGEGCDIVQTSQYASTFGIKNSYYGVFIFTFLTLISLWHIKIPGKRKKFIIHSAIIIGSIISLYFIYLQKFVLNAWCKYCLVVDISLILALFLIIFIWEK